MTVLLWILGILAVPTLIVVLWLGGVFVKEFVAQTKGTGDGEDGDGGAEAAEQLGLLPAERQSTEYGGSAAGRLGDGARRRTARR